MNTRAAQLVKQDAIFSRRVDEQLFGFAIDAGRFVPSEALAAMLDRSTGVIEQVNDFEELRRTA